MAPVLDLHLAEIADLCRRYGVARLEVFGSAVTDAFDLARSDIDFLIEFDDNPNDLFKRYFGLKAALETRLGRDVDLVMMGAMRNPHFIESVNRTRRLIYAADEQRAELRARLVHHRQHPEEETVSLADIKAKLGLS